jgi:hypothetical protein
MRINSIFSLILGMAIVTSACSSKKSEEQQYISKNITEMAISLPDSLFFSISGENREMLFEQEQLIDEEDWEYNLAEKTETYLRILNTVQGFERYLELELKIFEFEKQRLLGISKKAGDRTEIEQVDFYIFEINLDGSLGKLVSNPVKLYSTQAFLVEDAPQNIKEEYENIPPYYTFSPKHANVEVNVFTFMNSLSEWVKFEKIDLKWNGTRFEK